MVSPLLLSRSEKGYRKCRCFVEISLRVHQIVICGKNGRTVRTACACGCDSDPSNTPQTQAHSTFFTGGSTQNASRRSTTRLIERCVGKPGGAGSLSINPGAPSQARALDTPADIYARINKWCRLGRLWSARSGHRVAGAWSVIHGRAAVRHEHRRRFVCRIIGAIDIPQVHAINAAVAGIGALGS